MSWESLEPCCACGVTGSGMVCYHHELSRKAYPEHALSRWNLMPLCFIHHTQIHSMGTTRLSEKFPGIRNWLLKNGWEFNGRKWENPGSFAEQSLESQLQSTVPHDDWPLQ